MFKCQCSIDAVYYVNEWLNRLMQISNTIIYISRDNDALSRLPQCSVCHHQRAQLPGMVIVL